MRMDKNNEGMTLIELIIVIAISSIVIIMVITFINGALKGFHKTNDEVQLQMEAQTVINQITNIALQANSISTDLLSLDTEEDRYLLEGNTNYIIIFRRNTAKLYLKEITFEAGDTPDVKAAKAVAASYDDKENLFAEYTSEISFTMTDHNKSVLIVLTLRMGEEEYSVTKKVTLRNLL